ncbi:GntR family transcriptional regulator [Nocardioides sp. NPDC059952]|uniref:GntR family transcriptional regulator n=1 Tax=Nocardioides sp. NPDC059952 TaxID=3347014 RepID=UPI003648890E
MAPKTQTRMSGAHLVYLELKRRILDLELAPGERLFEPALSAELKVSRTPVREAVRRLIAENLLEQQPTGGVVVPDRGEHEVAELYDVRASLEALMAATAARRATETDHAQLRSLVERNAALVGFADDAMSTGKAIHTEIARIADNGWALRLHEQISNQLQRYRMYTNHTQRRRDEALAEHEELVDAVTGGDADRASHLAFVHVTHARDEAIRAISARD